jgi:hypothetical protein
MPLPKAPTKAVTGIEQQRTRARVARRRGTKDSRRPALAAKTGRASSSSRDAPDGPLPDGTKISGTIGSDGFKRIMIDGKLVWEKGKR